jgi:hypothetical protein
MLLRDLPASVRADPALAMQSPMCWHPCAGWTAMHSRRRASAPVRCIWRGDAMRLHDRLRRLEFITPAGEPLRVVWLVVDPDRETRCAVVGWPGHAVEVERQHGETLAAFKDRLA